MKLMNTIFISLMLAAAFIVIWLAAQGRLGIVWHSLVNKETHTGLFILFFMILPLIGFPISIFLLLLGVKFNLATAIIIMFCGMAIHIAVSFPAANTILQPLVKKALSKTRHRLPRFPVEGFLWPSILFMAVPGLSYTMKNYLFSISGVPFRYYFFIGWPIQAVLGLPLVIAGSVAGEFDYAPFILIFFGCVAAVYLLRRWMVHRADKGPSG